MRLRATFAGIALCASAFPVVAGFSTVACAAESDSAALVVDTGDDVFRYCVNMPDDSVTGIELIQLAGEQHGLQYSLGYGGQAVCRLQGVGPDGDDCFAEDPYFWGYWHGDGSGGWNWSSSGAGSYSVEPGDVEGWSWGTGQSGDSHPKPPATTYASVCPAIAESGGDNGAKKDRSKGGGDLEPSDGGAPAQPAAGASTQPATNEEPKPRKQRRDDGERDGSPARRRSLPSPEASLVPEPKDAVAAATEEASGPPAGGIAALIAALGLAGAGAIAARRRRG